MNVTASPIPITISGIEHEIHPLSDASIQSITYWVRGALIASARSSLEEQNIAPGERWEHTMAVAMTTSQTIDWFTDPGRLAIMTMGGRAKLMSESIKELTYQECLDVFKAEPNTMAEFWDLFVLVNDLNEPEEQLNGSKKKVVSFEDDRAELYRDLFENHGMTPIECSRHTPTQLKVISGLPPKLHFESGAEYQSYLVGANRG